MVFPQMAVNKQKFVTFHGPQSYSGLLGHEIIVLERAYQSTYSIFMKDPENGGSIVLRDTHNATLYHNSQNHNIQLHQPDQLQTILTFVPSSCSPSVGRVALGQVLSEYFGFPYKF
jgi:hypothetical protein